MDFHSFILFWVQTALLIGICARMTVYKGHREVLSSPTLSNESLMDQ